MKAVCPSAPRVIGCVRLRRRVVTAAAGAAVALGSIACSSSDGGNGPAPAVASGTDEVPVIELSGEGTLSAPGDAPGQTSNAVTYDPALAPAGARLAVTLTPSGGSTTATLEYSGLLPDRGYAVHLHTRPCGPTGDAAGPHFQHTVDPAATPEVPSSDPEYANPDNEIWLDIRTDATGSGTAGTEVPFVFTDRAPASVVVHKEMTTATEPGKAGKAGDRVACLSLPAE